MVRGWPGRISPELTLLLLLLFNFSFSSAVAVADAAFCIFCFLSDGMGETTATLEGVV